jgi:opacity protein-like surface antigen
MRNLLIAGALMLLGTGTACAQGTVPKTDFFVGYQYMHLNPAGRGCHGLDINLAYNVKDWVGGVGDFGYCKETGLPSGIGGHDVNYMFGPRVTYRNTSKLQPYGQLLIGGQHESIAGAGANSFALTLGGGVDYQYNDRFSVRVIQVEYLWNHFGGTGWNNARIQAGLVYNF